MNLINKIFSLSRYWNQSRSNFRTGEPDDHLQGKQVAANYIESFHYVTYQEYPLSEGKTWYYQHDIGVFHDTTISIEEGTNNFVTYSIKLILSYHKDPRDLIKYKHKKKLDEKLAMIVEIDDRDLHIKKAQRRKDGVAQAQAAKLAPYARFVRLDKDEVNGWPDLSMQYLSKYLRPYFFQLNQAKA